MRSFFRLLGSMFKWMFGWAGRTSDAMASNVNVMAATYDNSIKKGTNDFNTLQDAVSQILRIKIDKETQFKNLTKEVERLTNVKTGAGNKAKQMVDKLKAEGKSVEEIKLNAEVIKCQGAYNDASSSLKDKNDRLTELDAEIKSYDGTVAKYKAQLQQMQRNVENLRNEKSEAIAETAASRQANDINRLLTGIATSTQDEDLEAARRARKEMKAKAQISSELAGNDAKVADAEYLRYASDHEANSEFDNLLGLDSGKTEETPMAASKLPE